MENPRPEKVAVVDEVREKFTDSSAVLLTEYRGLNVAALAKLRLALKDAGGEFKIYKNTLVGFAAQQLELELGELLTGPTALAFVQPSGDPVGVAKALDTFAREHPALVIKGGVLDDRLLSADDAKALAKVEPREVLLAKLAGAMQAPMVQFAGLLQALPRNFAYGLKALIDQGGGAPDAPVAEEAAPAAEAPATEDASEAPQVDETPADSPAPEAESATENTEETE
jgi:large subunit ribosomal protein L10